MLLIYYTLLLFNINWFQQNQKIWIKYLFIELKIQLGEQSRCLDSRLDLQRFVLGELIEYCRARAEIELEYSRSLEKLVRTTQTRMRAERQKYFFIYLSTLLY